ncbi:MAG: TolC family protein [Pirellulales bacterium]|nr:TolC family protein [Pirellulales bacterium]
MPVRHGIDGPMTSSRFAKLVCLVTVSTFVGCGQSPHSGESASRGTTTLNHPSVLREDATRGASELSVDRVRATDGSGTAGEYRLVNFEDEFSHTGAPTRTVLAPGNGGKISISLAEAKRMAMSNNKNIEVLGFDPPAIESEIDVADSVFDPVLNVNALWGRIDEQQRSVVDSLSTTSNILNEDRFGEEDDIVSLTKLFSTGLEARVAYVLDYYNRVPGGDLVLVNPAWESQIVFELEQPFFKDAGRAYNLAPIYIAQANHEQSIQEFQAAVNLVLLEVETTYWSLFQTQANYEAAERTTKEAKELYDKQVELLKLGTGTKPDVDQALLQYQSFRIASVEALNEVLAAERDFRRAVGMEAYEEERIIPTTKPAQTRYVPNWGQAVHESEMRPELEAQRMAIDAAQLQLDRAYNQLLPDVRGVAGYSLNGLDNNWDESISTIFDNRFNNWELGFRYEYPFWRREANALARQAEFILGREQAAYRDIADEILKELYGAYQNLLTAYEVLELRRTQRRLAEEQVRARRELFGADMTNRVRFKDDLEAQQDLFAALQLENEAQAFYRIAIAQWQFAKGTILDDDTSVYMEPQPPEEEDVPPPAPDAEEGSSQQPRQPGTSLALPSLEVPLINQPAPQQARGNDVVRPPNRPTPAPQIVRSPNPPTSRRPTPQVGHQPQSTTAATKGPQTIGIERRGSPTAPVKLPAETVPPHTPAVVHQPKEQFAKAASQPEASVMRQPAPHQNIAPVKRPSLSHARPQGADVMSRPALTQKPSLDLKDALAPLQTREEKPTVAFGSKPRANGSESIASSPATARALPQKRLTPRPPIARQAKGAPIHLNYAEGTLRARVPENIVARRRGLAKESPAKQETHPAAVDSGLRFVAQSKQAKTQPEVKTIEHPVTIAGRRTFEFLGAPNEAVPDEHTKRTNVVEIREKAPTARVLPTTTKSLPPSTIKFSKQPEREPREARRPVKDATRQDNDQSPVFIPARVQTGASPHKRSPVTWLPKLGWNDNAKNRRVANLDNSMKSQSTSIVIR